MRLRTKEGQLDLPRDFSLTLERNNPLLSGEGDASVTATLPSSSHNLELIGHRERIDRAVRYTNKVDAILEVGPIQKRGQLVIDTVHRHVGIDASLAIDNGDLYASSKDKSLKEIFADWKDGIGMKIPFTSIDDACEYMVRIYKGVYTNTDFSVFPVAVSPYEEGEGDEKQTVYQYNNEASGDSLRFDERFVREGDINMLVPKGYGLAPFLKLQKLLERLFQCLDYTIEYNCFDEAPFYSQIVIVHNCADCLCNPDSTLYYKDLVPSCTLGEFLEWLLAKFHVRPVVDSESKTARIVKMDAVLNKLSGGYDQDISGLLEGDWSVQLNPSKRVVLTPTIEIEGTEAAAETLDKLLQKYGSFGDCSEPQFRSLLGDVPAFYDCLIRRKATGMFYILERSLSSGKMQLHELGTDYFVYDRDNSDETEGFSQADVMPLMLCGPKCETVPFIGDRIHLHTSYEGNADDSEQKIIAVQAHTSKRFIYRTSGTTQKSIPYADGNDSYNFWFGMDNYSLYRSWWSNYNRLLLNNPVHLKGRVRYSIAQFLNMDMSALKLFDGQRLLPVKASAQIGDRMGVTEAEFIRAEQYLDEVSDSIPEPVAQSTLKWQMNSESDYQTALTIFTLRIQTAGSIVWRGFSVEHDGVSDPIWLGTPSVLGEIRQITAMASFTIKTRERVTITNQSGSMNIWFDREWRPDGHYDADGNCLQEGPFNWLQQTKTYTFEAVSV